MGDHPTLIAEQLGDVGGLAAGSGAEIQDRIARLRIQLAHREQSAWVLHIESALDEGSQPRQRRVRLEMEGVACGDPVVVHRNADDAFGLPTLLQLFRRRAQRVHPDKGRGRRVVPFEHLPETHLSESSPPSVHQPGGVGPGNGWVRLLQLLDLLSQALPVPVASAKHRIHEPALLRKPSLPGQLNRLMDGCMGGDAIEEEQLIQAEPQQVMQGGLLRASSGPAVDDPVQRRALPHHPVNQLLRQPPIGRGQGKESGIGFHAMLHEVSRSARTLKGAEGNLSWSGNVHAPILSTNRQSTSSQFPPKLGRAR